MESRRKEPRGKARADVEVQKSQLLLLLLHFHSSPSLLRAAMKDLRCIRQLNHVLSDSHATVLASHGKTSYLVSHTRPSPDGKVTFDIVSLDVDSGSTKKVLTIDLVAAA